MLETHCLQLDLGGYIVDCKLGDLEDGLFLTPSCANYTEVDAGTECTWSCATGYDVAGGTAKRTCLSNSTWSGKPLRCEKEPEVLGAWCYVLCTSSLCVFVGAESLRWCVSGKCLVLPFGPSLSECVWRRHLKLPVEPSPSECVWRRDDEKEPEMLSAYGTSSLLNMSDPRLSRKSGRFSTRTHFGSPRCWARSAIG